MKTAHELLELFDLRQLTNYDKWIAAIEAVQLDAFKTGMTEAAEIARPHMSQGDLKQAILSARDKKETL